MSEKAANEICEAIKDFVVDSTSRSDLKYVYLATVDVLKKYFDE